MWDDIVRPSLYHPHVSNTDAGNVGLRGNPTSREPARRKRAKDLVMIWARLPLTLNYDDGSRSEWSV